MRICLALAACLWAVFGATPDRERSDQPNIIVIMADDLGYGDVSCYGATSLETPHIDQLAAEGLRFTSGYCSASTCTPTRYSLLTGTYAFRFKGTGIAPPNSPAIIQPGTETIASILQRAGYATGVIGKWHLGLGGQRRAGLEWRAESGAAGDRLRHLLPAAHHQRPRAPGLRAGSSRPNLDPADPLWVGNKKPSPDHPTGITHRDTLKMDWSHGHNSTIHNGISRIGFYTGGHAARFRDEDLADKWVEKSIEFIEREHRSARSSCSSPRTTSMSRGCRTSGSRERRRSASAATRSSNWIGASAN